MHERERESVCVFKLPSLWPFGAAAVENQRVSDPWQVGTVCAWRMAAEARPQLCAFHMKSVSERALISPPRHLLVLLK